MEEKLIEITRNEWTNDSIRLLMMPSNYAKKNLFYIQEIGFFKTTKDYYVKRKNLPSFLILQTLEGNGLLNYDGKDYILSKGDVCFIDCRKYHFYHIYGHESWIFNWVHFNGLSSQEHCDNYIRYNSRPVMNIEVNELNEIFRDLLNINHVNRNTNEILSSLKLTEIITILTLYCQSLHCDVTLSRDFADKAMWYIEKHLQEKITLESISKQFSMNKYSFHKLFKQHIGVPFNEFVILQRVKYAKELLRFSNMSVREVGDAVGISNTSYFINLFKGREGITPLQYKHQWDYHSI